MTTVFFDEFKTQTIDNLPVELTIKYGDNFATLRTPSGGIRYRVSVQLETFAAFEFFHSVPSMTDEEVWAAQDWS